MATSPGDEQTVQYMLQRWQDPQTGLDDAWREEYKVFLSFPDPQSPNKVTVGESSLRLWHPVLLAHAARPVLVISPSNETQFTASEKEVPYEPAQQHPDVVQPYAAYSPPGHPNGKLIYANQGKVSDYEVLNKTMNLAGTIAIVRYGGAGRAAKAINAAPFGVAGVLVYTDPLDINDGLSNETETYPHSWYLPPSGVERGSFNTHFGDLLTPYLAAKEHTYRIPEEDITGIPPIPIQPIGFEDAEELIWSAPVEWRGALKCPYNVGGPGFKPTSLYNNSDVQLDIYNKPNATLRVQGSPAVQSVVFTATKEVKTPGSDSTTVYDNWLRFFNRTSPSLGVVPNVALMTGAGSDYAAFIHFLGITSMDIAYTYDRSKTKARIYPAYHTAYDTFNYSSKYIDPGFKSHQTVARTAGNVLLRLADSLLVPFNCSDYAETLEKFLATANAVAKFRTEATNLNKIIQDSDLSKETPLKVRRINDQLMLLERAFLDPLAFPEKYGFRHVLWASRSSSFSTFPGLADAFAQANQTNLPQDWAQVHKHLSIVTQAIEGATHTLGDVI
ncbi:hypothetical protein JZ751_001087 [Albula glossodonta]|uniref:Aminopeptidase NAALADL1 n=1 Tax=Albula glossodonta TaxID=121402 RepID=A0A8T2PSQ9_9TELE|nr:hypothetical protein JZ751_001087 [Albula glossodonta]